MWIEDDIYRGATSVRARCLLSLFGYENTNWYPILLTVEFRVTLLTFKLPLVSPFQRCIRTGLHHTRLSITKHIRVLLLLNNLDYLILLSEYKKGFSSKKDEKPVVPPSLAEWSAHFTDIKTRMFEYLSLVTMRRSPKPTTWKRFSLGLRSPFPFLTTLICTNHQLSKVFKKRYYSSSQPYALFVNNHNINFIIRQLNF